MSSLVVHCQIGPQGMWSGSSWDSLPIGQMEICPVTASNLRLVLPPCSLSRGKPSHFSKHELSVMSPRIQIIARRQQYVSSHLNSDLPPGNAHKVSEGILPFPINQLPALPQIYSEQKLITVSGFSIHLLNLGRKRRCYNGSGTCAEQITSSRKHTISKGGERKRENQ